MSLKALMNAKTPVPQKVFDPNTGLAVAPRVNEFISRYMIEDFFVESACALGHSGPLHARLSVLSSGQQRLGPQGRVRCGEGPHL